MLSSSLLKSLAKIGIFSVWGLLVTALYYQSGHTEVFASTSPTTKIGLFGMIVGLFCLYAIYKGALFLGKQYKNTIGLPSVIGLFFAELLLLCFLFMGGAGLILFGKICIYLLLPVIILFILENFGSLVLSKCDTEFKNRSSGYQLMISMALGLSLFLFVLSIFVGTGFFTLVSVSAVLTLFAMLGHKEMKTSLISLWNTKIPLGETAFSSYTLLSELFFIVLSLLLSANFISIVRPMPIGWDDLGAYMNFPKMLAENGGLMNVGVIAWQSLTSIGFLFRSAPQAFFMNQIGGLLSVLFLIVGLGSLIKTFSEEKKPLFAPLPLIAATIFMALPMVVFEQAKDMKLDPGLFAITIAVLFGTYELLSRKEAPSRSLFVQIAAIGIIAGAAFAIKATSLMLFIAFAGLLCYEFIGLLGFFGFFAFFIGIFTKLKLWSMMNVVYPQNNDALLSIFGYSAMGIGLLLIA